MTRPARTGIWLTVVLLAALLGKPPAEAVAPPTRLNTLRGHTGEVLSVAFSPDGKTLASGSVDRTIKLWDVRTGKNTATLSGHTNWVYPVAFSPDGQTLASGGYDSTIKLWDVKTGKNTRTLFGHANAVYFVSFSSDGRTLMSASWDKHFKHWDVKTGKNLSTFPGATWIHYATTYSANGKLQVSGSAETTLKLWDVDARKYIATLTGHTSWIRAVCLSPDGKTLASGSADQTIRLWTITPSFPLTGSPAARDAITQALETVGSTIVDAYDDSARLEQVASELRLHFLHVPASAVLRTELWSMHQTYCYKMEPAQIANQSLTSMPLLQYFLKPTCVASSRLRCWPLASLTTTTRASLSLSGS